MIKEETINSFVFVEQTTYYIYKSKEDRENGTPSLTTSDKKFYESYKRKLKKSQ